MLHELRLFTISVQSGVSDSLHAAAAAADFVAISMRTHCDAKGCGCSMVWLWCFFPSNEEIYSIRLDRSGSSVMTTLS